MTAALGSAYRMFARSRSTRAAVLAACLTMAGPAFAAETSKIEGAWVEQSQKCGDVFAFKGGRPVFKQPVNLFAPAMIITGKQLKAPQAVCRLKSASPQADRVNVVLRCANSVSDADVSVSLAKTPDGRLTRFYDGSDRAGSRNTSFVQRIEEFQWNIRS